MKMGKFLKFLSDDRYRYQTYLFLNRPQHFLGILYQIFIATLAATCLILSICCPDILLFWLDILMTITFSLEFIVQIWASSCLPKYRSNRFISIRIILDPICLLDLLIIITTVIGIVTNHNDITMISSLLRGFRILQFFEHKYRLWRLIVSVIWNGRFQLLLCLYFALILFVFTSFAMFLIEQNNNEQLGTLGRSMWFTLITLSTVGYGDTYPITTTGKIVTAFAVILGLSVFSLPGGIIGAGLALKVENEETIRSELQENNAARVIQSAWKVYRSRRLLEQSSSRPLTISITMTGNGQTLKKRSLNLRVIQFVDLLKFSLSCRRFKKSLRMLSAKNFHELYSQNCMEQMEKLAILEMIIRDQETTLHELLSLLRQKKQKRRNVEEKSLLKKQKNAVLSRRPNAIRRLRTCNLNKSTRNDFEEIELTDVD